MIDEIWKKYVAGFFKFLIYETGLKIKTETYLNSAAFYSFNWDIVSLFYQSLNQSENIPIQNQIEAKWNVFHNSEFVKTCHEKSQ